MDDKRTVQVSMDTAQLVLDVLMDRLRMICGVAESGMLGVTLDSIASVEAKCEELRTAIAEEWRCDRCRFYHVPPDGGTPTAYARGTGRCSVSNPWVGGEFGCKAWEEVGDVRESTTRGA